ncbi:MAG TPA: glycosyltransferase [Polyangiaceae bacterium]|nr:glycosyltransferase [Polyangiaceae bacterium]
MRIALFCHSLLSDYNHGGAHFLRGIVSELSARGHEVLAYEPTDGWSMANLVKEQGTWPISAMRQAYPAIRPVQYDPVRFDLARAVDGADVVIVHEWNDQSLVHALGKMRRGGAQFRLLFHDTHHRAVTEPEGIMPHDLAGYDGVLAFGQVLRDIYLERSLIQRAWVWHEAADVRVFAPLGERGLVTKRQVVYVGNWSDGEREHELFEFVASPVADLRLSATVHGVGYPERARVELLRAGVHYAGYLPNFCVPQALARHHVSVHLPRRPYGRTLPGIPSVGLFEALACGIPVVSTRFDDSENLFAPGRDFLAAQSKGEMKRHVALLVGDPRFARELAQHGRQTILKKHTCAHRVDELLEVFGELGIESEATRRAS